MTLTGLLKRAEKLITDNSPGILTGLAVAGSVATAYLTGVASMRAARLIDETEAFGNYGLEPKEKVILVWRMYLPAVITGGVTVTCIIFSNRIGSRRAAAVAAAYSLTERAFEEYRDKVVEKLGERKEQAIRDEIVQDRMDRHPPVQSQVIVTGTGDVLCTDAYSGRYFNSSVESIRQAQNDVNFQILHDGYASLTDFYDRLGLSSTQISDNVGWNSGRMLEIFFSAALTPEQKPCVSIEFSVEPYHNYTKVYN